LGHRRHNLWFLSLRFVGHDGPFLNNAPWETR
jgi:hypothetical protein